MPEHLTVDAPAACPYVVEQSDTTSLDTILSDGSWRDLVRRHGAVVLRGLEVTSAERFRDTAQALSASLFSYTYDSNKRTPLGEGVYTASDRAKWLTITLHNECSYTRDWPMTLLFGCIETPADGGETLLARTVDITARIDPKIRASFRERRVMYVRNYRPGVDLPWQTVFHTSSKTAVEEYCRNNEIDLEWRENDTLRTKQIAQGTAIDPRTGEELWFNQAHTYHISSLEPRTRAALLATYSEEDLPRNAYYGDGGRIEDETITAIHDAYNAEVLKCRWRRGDVLIVDNMQMVHGRAPFKGNRLVLVTMMESFAEVTATAAAALTRS